MALTDDDLRIGQWAKWHALAMLAATTVVLVFGRVEPIVLTAVVSFATYALMQRGLLSQFGPLGGHANQLTFLRLALLCVAAIGIGSLDWRAMFALFLANVALDVLDGYVARRRNQVTKFGAALDRETDAVFVLVACLYFGLALNVGPWILVQAVLPYFYRIVTWVIPDTKYSEVKQPYAARLAGVNFGLLLLAVAVPDSARLTILIISTATVVFSFMISFRDLYRHRHANSVL
jgi:phosphatidylglycerophosphate synthase